MKGIKRTAIIFCAMAAALTAVNTANGSLLTDIGLSVSVSAATVSDISYVDAAGESHTSESCTVVENNSTTWGTNNAETWYVVNSSVTVSRRITVKGTVNLILADNCSLTASNGINVPQGSTLIIWQQENGSGSLNAAASSSNYAGIGGNGNDTAGTIVINGGNITARGGSSGGAGIGGGWYGDFTKIEINGGNITAVSENYAAGIGAGRFLNKDVGAKIIINGGTIDAHGGPGVLGVSKADNVGNSAYYNWYYNLPGGGYADTVIVNDTVFTVIIPENVEIGSSCDISAAGVSISSGKTLKVTVSSDDIIDNSFIMKYETDNDISLKYKLIDGDVEKKSGDTVLAVSSTETGGSSSLSTELDDTPIYSGRYTGKLTFNITVE